MIKTFFKDGIIYSIPTFISRGMSILLVPLYTRILSPADYGAWDMLIVFMNMVRLTVALEIAQAVARFYAEEKTEKDKAICASTALWFTVVTNGIFMIVSQFFAREISTLLLGSADLTFIFRLGSVLVFCNSVFYLIQNQFRWELKSKNYSIASLIVSLLTAVLSIVLAFVFNLGLSGILAGSIAGAVFGAVYGLVVLKKTFRFKFSVEKLKPMLRFSSPLVLSGIAVFVSHYIDRVMIRHFLSLDALGLYSLAFRISSVISLVMVGFNSALTPLVYRHHQDKVTPGHLATILRYFMFFALLAFMWLSLFSREIMIVFTTREFYPAANVLMFLVPAIILANMYVFAPGNSIRKKTSNILLINLTGAFLQVALNYIMIPRFGYVGAAAATCIGNFCIFCMYMITSQRLYPVPHQWLRFITGLLIVFGIIYIPLMLDWKIWPEFYLKITLFFIGFGLLLALKFVKRGEFNKIKLLFMGKGKSVF